MKCNFKIDKLINLGEKRSKHELNKEMKITSINSIFFISCMYFIFNFPQMNEGKIFKSYEMMKKNPKSTTMWVFIIQKYGKS